MLKYEGIYDQVKNTYISNGQVRALDAARNKDGDYDTIDGDDTGHNDWNDTFHNSLWLQNGHGGNTDTRFGCSISGTHTTILIDFYIGVQI